MKLKTHWPILIYLLISVVTTTFAQQITPLVINSTGKSFQTSATGMDINIGESITGFISNGHNQITQGFLQPDKDFILLKLHLKVFIQGYYNIASHAMEPTLSNENVPGATSLQVDTITVELHAADDPETVSASSKSILMTDGTTDCSFEIELAQREKPYYIVVNYKRAIETWSHNPVTFTSTPLSYDFTTAYTQAYDDGVNFPMQLMASAWTLYSGDINRDGTIDILDMVLLDNEIGNFPFGYVDEDINGDGAVDILDMTIVDNNNRLFLYKARPY